MLQSLVIFCTHLTLFALVLSSPMSTSVLDKLSILVMFFLSVREPEGGLKLYCKGADIVILERLQKDLPYQESIERALEVNWSFYWTISVCCYGAYYLCETLLVWWECLQFCRFFNWNFDLRVVLDKKSEDQTIIMNLHGHINVRNFMAIHETISLQTQILNTWWCSVKSHLDSSSVHREHLHQIQLQSIQLSRLFTKSPACSLMVLLKVKSGHHQRQ